VLLIVWKGDGQVCVHCGLESLFLPECPNHIFVVIVPNFCLKLSGDLIWGPQFDVTFLL